MGASLTRFEVLLPNTDNGTPSQLAVTAFMNGMKALLPNNTYNYQSNRTDDGMDFITFFGYLTSTQAGAALQLLATLNANVGVSYSPVTAVTWTAGSQP